FEFIYCEAITPQGAVQVWNMASNAVFIALAAYVWRRHEHTTHRYGLPLIACGSISWHASQSQWALALDISAIIVWAALYTLDLARQHQRPVAGLLAQLSMWLVASVATGLALAQPLPLLSGAFIPYAAAMLAMPFIKSCPPARRMDCVFSGTAMTLAIIAREADLAACPYIPIGTHWLWHLLTGLSLLAPIRFLSRRDEY
ncbi:MAG: hypothetical protein K0U66_05215, partial [Gammaproteobacteria bacterium]|nr:hypothetical protein [Gammaproteobacteria bacterium]